MSDYYTCPSCNGMVEIDGDPWTENQEAFPCPHCGATLYLWLHETYSEESGEENVWFALGFYND